MKSVPLHFRVALFRLGAADCKSTNARGTADRDDYVLNHALIFRDRRDFLIRDGDNDRRDKELD